MRGHDALLSPVGFSRLETAKPLLEQIIALEASTLSVEEKELRFTELVATEGPDGEEFRRWLTTNVGEVEPKPKFWSTRKKIVAGVGVILVVAGGVAFVLTRGAAGQQVVSSGRAALGFAGKGYGIGKNTAQAIVAASRMLPSGVKTAGVLIDGRGSRVWLPLAKAAVVATKALS